uniref:NADH-ubiquinone oxidoreductase chain 3 n=1 Tax=Neostromboceros nipponicus TaxID=2805799 RepID=A0A8A6C315_9HYME|nr:NADH dehydrogenase subunit 3 [Neostromboceros nipponicus]QTH79153.1 NADH dehydrogenase subunit 3 [Neostromboceros nipponicus]UQS76351.1 NADH dehydrogenase subunit 3 [Neostromboceros nipponicus]
MLLIMNILLIIMIISLMIMMITSMLSKKTFYDREKNSPFECGFDPKGKSRLPFSIRFFLIAVIFLIFDVEIVLMLPMILILKISNLFNWFILSSYFIIILIMGLYYEWKFGALNWL